MSGQCRQNGLGHLQSVSQYWWPDRMLMMCQLAMKIRVVAWIDSCRGAAKQQVGHCMHVVAVMHSLLPDLRQVASVSGRHRFQEAPPALRFVLAIIVWPRYLPRCVCWVQHRGLLSHSESLLPWLSLAPAPALCCSALSVLVVFSVELLLLPSTS